MSGKPAGFGDCLGILVMPMIVGVFGYLVRNALKTGVIETRNGDFARAERPGSFWSFTIGFSAVAMLGLALGIFSFLDLLGLV